MPIQFLAPSPALAPYVEQYCLCDEGLAPQALVPEPGLPGLVSVLSIGYNGHFCETILLLGNTTRSEAVAQLMDRVTRQQRYRRQNRPAGVLSIYFHPTGFFNLFGASIAAVAHNAGEPGEDASRFMQELGRRVQAATTPIGKLAAAEELLLERLSCKTKALPTAIGQAIALVQARHGQVAVEELAEAVQLSRRQLERRFLMEVGTTPKRYTRIARFNHVFELLKQQPTLAWPDISYLCGYFDQAHLIREFHRFTGQSPGHYLHYYNGLSQRNCVA